MEQNCQDDGGGAAAGGGMATGSKSSSYLCRQSSARWIPTGDQIRILRDLYYNYGVRSPSAEQIQRISAKLRQYGKIEGKNVFYWFQNHKARERQKKRLTTDISNSNNNSTTNKLGSAPMCSYDAGQFGNSGSLLGEKSFRGCCFSGGGGGGDGTESGLGWFGLETALQVTPWAYHCAIGGQEMVSPAAASARAMETLPLFPIRSQEEVEEQELQNPFYSCGGVGVQSQEENFNGYQQRRRGGGGASLELTLNSYYYEPPSSPCERAWQGQN